MLCNYVVYDDYDNQAFLGETCYRTGVFRSVRNRTRKSNF